MSDRAALVLGLVILAAMAADWLFNGAAALIFLFGKLQGVIDVMVFWR
jgi:hypothetical protein